MSELNMVNHKMISDGEYESMKNGRRGMVKAILALFVIALITMIILLMFGISPLGRYLQSVEWIYNLARSLCG